MTTTSPVHRSNFVTVLAWVMIAFGVFSVLMALLQSVLVNMLLPMLESAMPQTGPAGALPLAFLQVAMLAALAFSVFMTYGAYALLKRRNWARILYFVMFIVSAVLHVLIAAAFGIGFSLIDLPTANAGFPPTEFQVAFRAIAVTLAILMLAMAVGYVWLARRLLSPAIAAEFGVRPRPAV